MPHKAFLDKFEEEVIGARPGDEDEKLRRALPALADYETPTDVGPVASPGKPWYKRAGATMKDGVLDIIKKTAQGISYVDDKLPGSPLIGTGKGALRALEFSATTGGLLASTAKVGFDIARTGNRDTQDVKDLQVAWIKYDDAKKAFFRGDFATASVLIHEAQKLRPDALGGFGVGPVSLDKDLGLFDPLMYVGWGLGRKVPLVGKKLLGPLEHEFIKVANVPIDLTVRGTGKVLSKIIPQSAFVHGVNKLNAGTRAFTNVLADTPNTRDAVTKRLNSILLRGTARLASLSDDDQIVFDVLSTVKDYEEQDIVRLLAQHYAEVEVAPGKTVQAISGPPRVIKDTGPHYEMTDIISPTSDITRIMKEAKTPWRGKPSPQDRHVRYDLTDTVQGYASGDMTLHEAAVRMLDIIGGDYNNIHAIELMAKEVEARVTVAREGAIRALAAGKGKVGMIQNFHRQEMARVIHRFEAQLDREAETLGGFKGGLQRTISNRLYPGYAHIWRDIVQKRAVTPLAQWNLFYMGYALQNAIEAHMFSLLGGGGHAALNSADFISIAASRGLTNVPIDGILSEKKIVGTLVPHLKDVLKPQAWRAVFRNEMNSWFEHGPQRFGQTFDIAANVPGVPPVKGHIATKPAAKYTAGSVSEAVLRGNQVISNYATLPVYMGYFFGRLLKHTERNLLRDNFHLSSTEAATLTSEIQAMPEHIMQKLIGAGLIGKGQLSQRVVHLEAQHAQQKALVSADRPATLRQVGDHYTALKINEDVLENILSSEVLILPDDRAAITDLIRMAKSPDEVENILKKTAVKSLEELLLHSPGVLQDFYYGFRQTIPQLRSVDIKRAFEWVVQQQTGLEGHIHYFNARATRMGEGLDPFIDEAYYKPYEWARTAVEELIAGPQQELRGILNDLSTHAQTVGWDIKGVAQQLQDMADFTSKTWLTDKDKVAAFFAAGGSAKDIGGVRGPIWENYREVMKLKRHAFGTELTATDLRHAGVPHNLVHTPEEMMQIVDVNAYAINPANHQFHQAFLAIERTRGMLRDFLTNAKPQSEELARALRDEFYALAQRVETLPDVSRRKLSNALAASFKDADTDLGRWAPNFDRQNATAYFLKSFFPYITYASQIGPMSARALAQHPRLYLDFGPGGTVWDNTERGYVPSLIGPPLIPGDLTEMSLLRTTGANRFAGPIGEKQFLQQHTEGTGFFANVRKALKLPTAAGFFPSQVWTSASALLDEGNLPEAFGSILPPIFETALTQSSLVLAGIGVEGAPLKTFALFQDTFVRRNLDSILLHWRQPGGKYGPLPTDLAPDKLDALKQRQEQDAAKVLARITLLNNSFGLLRVHPQSIDDIREQVAETISALKGEDAVDVREKMTGGKAFAEIWELTPFERERLNGVSGYSELRKLNRGFQTAKVREHLEHVDAFYDERDRTKLEATAQQLVDDQAFQAGALGADADWWRKRLQERGADSFRTFERLKKQHPGVILTPEQRAAKDKELGIERKISDIDLALDAVYAVDADAYINPLTREINWYAFYAAQNAALSSFSPETQAEVRVWRSRNQTPLVREYRQGQEQYGNYFSQDAMVDWVAATKGQAAAQRLRDIQLEVAEGRADVRASMLQNPTAYKERLRTSRRIDAKERETITRYMTAYHHALQREGGQPFKDWFEKFYGKFVQ